MEFTLSLLYFPTIFIAIVISDKIYNKVRTKNDF